jgi:hypothetical protein
VSETMGEPVVLTSGPFKGLEGILRHLDERVAEVETALGVTLRVSPEEVWVGTPPMETWVGKPPKKEEGKKGRKERKGGKEEGAPQPEIEKIRAEEEEKRKQADKEFKRLILSGLIEIECRGKPRCSLCGQDLPGEKAGQVVEQYRKHQCAFVTRGRRTYWHWRSIREKGGIQYLHRAPPKTVVVGNKPLQVYWRVVLMSLGAHGKVLCGGSFPKVKALAELVEKAIPGATVRVQLDGTVEVEE